MRLLTIFCAATAVAFGAPTLRQDRTQTFQRENVLGTSFEMKVAAPSPAMAEAAEKAALDEIRREASILSSWDAESEFSRWFRTRGEAVRVSRELLEVLGLFDQWRERTGGALDASAEAATRAWKSAAAQGRVPTREEMARAVAEIRQSHWRLDTASGTAIHLSGTPLAMNSFVKSYILERAAAAALASPGVSGVLVNIGGDLVARGAWTENVGIADPRSDGENAAPVERLMVSGRAVATSGSYRRGFDIAGQHYSHIVDPRTGQSAGQIVSATVISPNATDAGAMATAFCVLSPAESARVAATVPGTEYLILTADGKRFASPGWAGRAPRTSPSFVAAKPAPSPTPAPQAASAAMEMTVGFELAQLGGYARRPYVAVWIEDKDHFPVRTLALWYQKDRWLPDLRGWYRGDRLRAMAEGNEIAASVASATRPAGKYTVKWDGKDNAGKPVKPGKYTVCIEAAREHGTYQIMRQEVDWNGSAAQFTLPGNQEISSASIDTHKAAH
jgi:thiamine biosynthesis lipoprotein ApbE